MKDLSVLIVEDDPLIAESLRLVTEYQNFQHVDVVYNALDALKLLKTSKIDFAILDVDLGGGLTGLDIAQEISLNYKIPYIFLTAFDDDATLNSAQEFSPYGYLVKPFQERSLLTTIKMAFANFQKAKVNHELIKKNIDRLIIGEFTNQEFNITKELMKGKTYQQIADDNFISTNTVKFHAKNIYAKFDIRGRAQLVTRIFKS